MLRERHRFHSLSYEIVGGNNCFKYESLVVISICKLEDFNNFQVKNISVLGRGSIYYTHKTSEF